jgi:hypothetical protein
VPLSWVAVTVQLSQRCLRPQCAVKVASVFREPDGSGRSSYLAGGGRFGDVRRLLQQLRDLVVPVVVGDFAGLGLRLL